MPSAAEKHSAHVVAERLAHPEGPDVLPDAGIIFVETFLGKVSLWNPTNGVCMFADLGGAPNACMLGLDGLYVTQNGGTVGEWRSPHPTEPAVQKVTRGGAIEVVTTSADGIPLIAPNDLSFGPDERLYFTDPGHWDPEDPQDGRVCVIDADGRTSVLEEVGATYPNGIAVEADGSVVWVESYTRCVRRRRPSGTVELVTTLPDGHLPDGLKIAEDGNLYIATVTSGGIDLISPDGAPAGFVDTGGEPQNCVFDGADLYVADFGEVSQFSEEGMRAATECGRLLRIRVDVPGMRLFRGRIQASSG